MTTKTRSTSHVRSDDAKSSGEATARMEERPGATSRDKTSLSEFVDDNYRVMNAIGVFTALSFYSAGLPVAFFAQLISILMFITSLLLWWEMWSKLANDRRPKSGPLVWYSWMLAAMPVLGGSYLVVEYHQTWRYLFYVPLYALTYYALNVLLSYVRSTWTPLRLPPVLENRIVAGLTRVLAAGALAFLVLQVATAVSPWIYSAVRELAVAAASG